MTVLFCPKKILKAVSVKLFFLLFYFVDAGDSGSVNGKAGGIPRHIFLLRQVCSV